MKDHYANYNTMGNLIDTITAYSSNLPNLLLDFTVAVLVVLIGFILGRIVGRFLTKALHEAEVDSVLKKTGFNLPFEKGFSAIIKYFFYIAAVIIALDRLGIATTALQVALFGAIILILLIIFVSLRDFIPNAIAGFFAYKKGLLHKGDTIEIQGITGNVENFGLVETEITTKKKERIYIPNSNLLKFKVKVMKTKARKSAKTR
jgi:small-conductance mechanosensitive channel